MKLPYNIWSLNMIVAISLSVMAIFQSCFFKLMDFADWKTSSLLSIEVYLLLYAVYFASTQSSLQFLKTKSVLFIVLRQLVFALVYTYLLVWFWTTLYPEKQYMTLHGASFYFVLFVSWFVLSVLGIIFHLVNYILDQKQRILLENGVQELKNEAELFKLRQQLHPHFLFNSLNSINALIGADPKLARSMLLKLSSFLRQTIRKEDSKLVSLQAELEELDLYMDIEKVRFGDRLIVEKELPENIGSAYIPPFLLQPLLENAIKFGLYDTLGEVLISIRFVQEPYFYKFEITNPFDPSSVAPKGTGFGLAGVARRLYLLYARNDLLLIDKIKHDGESEIQIFKATLLIPIDEGEMQNAK